MDKEELRRSARASLAAKTKGEKEASLARLRAEMAEDLGRAIYKTLMRSFLDHENSAATPGHNLA
jgi:hypothetical protein